MSEVNRGYADARRKLNEPIHNSLCTCDLCVAYKRAYVRRNSARPRGYEQRARTVLEPHERHRAIVIVVLFVICLACFTWMLTEGIDLW